MSHPDVNRLFSLTEQIQFYLMQRFPTRQNHDYRMDPNDDPIYDEYTSSGNNVTEEDRHWNFNIGIDLAVSNVGAQSLLNAGAQSLLKSMDLVVSYTGTWINSLS